MLISVWSPKGGSGTSVFAAALSIVLARRGPARLADLAGDQPAILGMSEPVAGLRNWLAVGPGAPAEAVERIAVEVCRGLTLLPTGPTRSVRVNPEAGAALGVILREDPIPTVADLGTAPEGAVRAVGEVADHSVVLIRGCYLALRRAVRHPLLDKANAVVLVEEPGRALRSREIADVLGVSVVARVPVRTGIARIVDAGVLPARLPEMLANPAHRLLAHLGIGAREDRVA